MMSKRLFYLFIIILFTGSSTICFAGALRGGDWIQMNSDEKVFYLKGYYDGDLSVRYIAFGFAAALEQEGIVLKSENAKVLGNSLLGYNDLSALKNSDLIASLDYIYSIEEIRNLTIPIAVGVWKDVLLKRITQQDGLSKLIQISKTMNQKQSFLDD